MTSVDSGAVAEHQRDAGLVRAVGPWGLAASVINCVIGASPFVLPAALAAYIGVFAPLAYLVGAIAVGAVAICFAEAGSRVSTSGGTYGYIEAAFGPLPAYVTGVLQLIGDTLGCASITAALADMVVHGLMRSHLAPTRAVIIVSVIAGLAILNIGGVGRAARFINAVTLAKLLPLAIFVIVGAGSVHTANLLVDTRPSLESCGRALILILFALSGMETSLSASGEVLNPARTVPRALAIAMLTVVGLYVSVQVVTQGILGAALARSTMPLADAMTGISPTLRILMIAGAALSMFGFLSSNVLGTPRMLFALARDGLLPRILGRVHARHRTPHIAILLYSALALSLALTGTFVELAILSALVTVPVYIAGCFAAWRLAQRGVRRADEPLNFPWLVPAVIIGVGSMLTLIALASRREMLGLTALIVGSALGYVLQTRVFTRRC
jgi:APA family basic amino acid/polyamine antiporter